MKKYTDSELKEIAKYMIVPVRCGGTRYEDGQLYYIFQGKKLTESQFKALQGLNTQQLNDKIEEYKLNGIL